MQMFRVMKRVFRSEDGRVVDPTRRGGYPVANAESRATGIINRHHEYEEIAKPMAQSGRSPPSFPNPTVARSR